MCYSVRTSLISFSLGMISSFYAFYTKQYTLGCLILFFSQMQLSEALIWRGIDTNDTNLNRIGTLYGKYTLPTHVFAVGLGIVMSYYYIHKQKSLSLDVYMPLIVGILFYLFIIVIVYPNHPDSSNLTYPADRSCTDKSCQNNNNRLQWVFYVDWYSVSFILCLMIASFYVTPRISQYWIAGLLIISFAISNYVYPLNNGSVWCFSAAILAPLLVVVNSMLLKSSSQKLWVS